MRALIIHPEDGVRRSIEDALRSVSESSLAIHQTASAGEALSACRWFGPDLVFLDLSGDRDLAVETARALRRPGRSILGLYNPLLVGAGFDRLRLAARAGVDDFLPLPLAEAELQEALAEIAAAATAGESEGAMLSFVAPTGGMGSTTLAVNAALILAGSGVLGTAALCDAVPKFGCVGPYMGLAGDKDLASLLADESGIDALATYVSEEPRTGLKVLPAPRDPADGERLSPEDLSRGLIGFRRRYDVTVVDAVPSLELATLRVLDLSDLVFVVSEATTPAVALTSSFLRVLAALGFSGDRVRLVVNKHSPEKGTLRVAEISDRLGRLVDHTIPWDDDAVAAVNRAVPLILAEENSPFADAARAVVEDAVQSLRAKRKSYD